jgi:hypothetical protein
MLAVNSKFSFPEPVQNQFTYHPCYNFIHSHLPGLAFNLLFFKYQDLPALSSLSWWSSPAISLPWHLCSVLLHLHMACVTFHGHLSVCMLCLSRLMYW